MMVNPGPYLWLPTRLGWTAGNSWRLTGWRSSMARGGRVAARQSEFTNRRSQWWRRDRRGIPFGPGRAAEGACATPSDPPTDSPIEQTLHQPKTREQYLAFGVSFRLVADLHRYTTELFESGSRPGPAGWSSAVRILPVDRGRGGRSPPKTLRPSAFEFRSKLRPVICAAVSCALDLICRQRQWGLSRFFLAYAAAAPSLESAMEFGALGVGAPASTS